jgi:hypothetical protein
MSERLGHRGVRRGSPRGVVGRWLVLTLASLLVLTVAATSATAFPTKLSANGQLDFNYGSAVQSAGGPSTGYKPESKLFYTGDGSTEAVRWWAVLGTSGPSPSAGVYLWELVNHTWVARVVLPGADPWAKADTLFDGSTLYVSTRDDKGSVSGNPRESDLYEVSYLGGGGWGSISGPFPITTGGPETLTIAKDSAGRIWTTFESGLNIKVGYTAPGGTSFTFITVSKTSVNSDDISEVTAFGGNKIGVFWSDQVAKRDFFAWRSDSDPITSNWTIETAYGGGVGGCPTANSDLCADDHLNVKVYNGEVYVAIKTSLNNVSGGPNDPLIALLKRTSGGTWSAFPVSTVSQNATRPITVLSPGQNAIWVWAARGGEIDVWESSFTSPGFSSGAFQTWVKGGGSADDPTGTKQVTSAATGTVVEASIKGSNQYWHNEFLPTSAPPVPTITGFSPTSGPVGTSVTITGSGFTGTSDVRFNGTSVGSGNYTVNSDTQVTAKVPSGATNGPISLDAPGGTATSSTSFTVTAPSAISEVQRKHASANDVSISATLDSAPTPGDVLAVVIVVSQASSPVFVTPPGWTAPFSPARGAVFWKVSNGTEQTLTVNLGAGETSKVLRMWIVELGGADTTNPFDQHGSGIFTSAVTTVTPTTDGATNQASGWAIAVVGHNGDNGGGASATNGFAVLGGGSSRDIGASKTLTALGTISTTISWTTARTGCWIIATFRGAGG